MLVVTSLSKAFATRDEKPVHAVDDVSFVVGEGEFFSIVGASGCGKTTVLRSIAGLETPDSGEISIGGRAVFASDRGIDLPTQRRDVSLMFQSYAIWPHMTVFENVAFPLKARGAGDIDRRVGEALAAVSLGELKQRPASRLSGGQQQRLALARAIISNPRVLLLDEPLSNLDVKLREQMRIELKRIQREHGVTTIYVTHDQAEALSLSDKIAVMEKGRLLQVGTPRQIYQAPRGRAVAEFVGQTNLLPATRLADAAGDGQLRFATPVGTLTVAANGPAPPAGEAATLLIRPESVLVGEAAGTAAAANRIAGTVDVVMYYGAYQDVQIRAGGALLMARLAGGIPIAAGDRVVAAIDPRDVGVV
jgi:iron(III) transport system ATP-binding protein